MKKALLASAGLLAALFLACHAAGLRESMCILSGTYPATGSAISGVVYAGVYLAFTILAPIFALGAGALFLLERGFGGAERKAG